MLSEIDLDEEQYRAKNGHPMPAERASRLIAELRASRKVLRELLEVDAEVGLLANVVGDWGSTEADIDRATRAFEALRSLVNVRNEETK